jgi:hypothetical protein
MYQAYYPASNAMALIWLNNYKTQIGVQGPLLGLSAAQIATQVTAVQKLIDGINDIETKRQAFSGAVAAFKTTEANFLAPLKVEIARYKTNPNYTQAIGQILGVVGSSSVVDAATYKCKFTVEHFGGFVRIQFVKAGVEGVNIYHRQKGQLQWKFLARDTKSPYHDHIVLQTPGQPEHWEYQLFGVINDVEIGLASDIVEVVFGA